MDNSDRLRSRFTLLVAGLLLVLTSLTNEVPVYAYSGQGSGTSNDPFLIANCVQLQEMEDDLDAHYQLADDIDCSDTENWNGLKGFDPVGDSGSPFTGSLNGNGYAILDLTILRADDTSGQGIDDENFVGLFGYTNGASLTDIELSSAMIKGFSYVGGIVGYMQNGTLTRSDVNRDVADNDCDPGHCIWARYGEYGGALAGFQDGGQISHSSADGPVKGSGNMIGGLVGSMTSFAQLSNSYAQGNIDGGNNIGGAVGLVSGQSTLMLVHASGNVDANDNDDFKQGQYAGGLVGYLSNSNIFRSYATGNVHADQFNVGGLVGEMTGGNIHNSYASGDVYSDNTYAGGLVGTIYDSATIRSSYASGNVTADGSTAGGFASEALVTTGDETITIEDSFASGAVTSSASSGGFIANLGAEEQVVLDNNFYDIFRTTYEHCTGTGTDIEGCTGVNNGNSQPSYFLENSTSPPLNNWDFENLWNVTDNSYPTLDNGADSDGDGQLDKVENAGPNNGDANGDGDPDSEQANVYSFVNPYSNSRQVLETDCESISIIVIDDPEYETDANFTYPSGLLSFIIECDTPGATATVSIYDYDNDKAEEAVVRKSQAGQYSTLPHSYDEVTVGGEPVPKFTYSLADGGEHDEDETPNGTIVDPVGIAIPLGAGSGGNNGSESDGQDSGNGAGEGSSTLAETGDSTTAPYIISIIMISFSLLKMGYHIKNHFEL